jgi:ABC-2 type transport system permease protein
VRRVPCWLCTQLQYRVSFALDLAGAFFITFIDFLAIVVIFSHLPRLAGWSLSQVALFYGIANLSFALCDLFIGHFDLLPQMIRSGSFDLLLVRPAGTLFQVIASDLALRRLGRAAQGLVVLAAALWWLRIPWTPARAIVLVLTVPAGTLIYASVWIAFMTITFWAVEAREVANAFTYGGSFLASYPVNIFGGWLRGLLAFVVPMAFVSYFPGVFIMGAHDPLGSPVALQLSSPLIALAAALIAGRIWQFGVRQYRSTGS